MNYEKYRRFLSAVRHKNDISRHCGDRVAGIINAVCKKDIRGLIKNSEIKSVSGLCKKYALPRKTVYRWINYESDIPDYIIEHIGYSEICILSENVI